MIEPELCEECGYVLSSYGVYSKRSDNYLIFCTNPRHKVHLPNCYESQLDSLQNQDILKNESDKTQNPEISVQGRIISDELWKSLQVGTVTKGLSLGEQQELRSAHSLSEFRIGNIPTSQEVKDFSDKYLFEFSERQIDGIISFILTLIYKEKNSVVK